jgi:hypothetical protein
MKPWSLSLWCLLLATASVAGPAQAQQLSLSPSATVSTSATSNRDLQPPGQENAQLLLTTLGTLNAQLHAPRAEGSAEYRLFYFQPLQTEDDEALLPELNHTLALGTRASASERLTLGASLDGFWGEDILQTVSPTRANPADPATPPTDPVTTALGDLAVERTRFLQLGGRAFGEVAVTPRDRLRLTLGGSWRRSQRPTLLTGSAQDRERLAQLPASRDASVQSLAGSWEHDLDETLQAGLDLEQELARFDEGVDGTTLRARARLRKRWTDRLDLNLSAGAIANAPDADDEDLQGGTLAAPQDDLLLSWALGAGLGARWEAWALSLNYGRDVTQTGTTAGALLLDAASFELVYAWDRALAVRATGSASLARPAAEADPTYTGALAGGVGVLVPLSGWLYLDSSYTVLRQDSFGGNRQEGTDPTASVSGDLRDEVMVHTVFLGLSARTDFGAGDPARAQP